MELQTRTSSERHIITRDKDFQACSNMMFRGRPEDVVGEGGSPQEIMEYESFMGRFFVNLNELFDVKNFFH